MPDASSAPAPSPAPAAGSGRAGASVTLYRERLLPGPAVWVVGALGGAMFGVILVPVSTTLALVAGLAMAAAVCMVLALTSPQITVSEAEVVCGPAVIEPELLGSPAVLETEAWAEAMGPGFEPLAHHCTRGWIHQGVRIPVLDTEDPTTAWLVSSRRPTALAQALVAAGAGI